MLSCCCGELDCCAVGVCVMLCACLGGCVRDCELICFRMCKKGMFEENLCLQIVVSLGKVTKCFEVHQLHR